MACRINTSGAVGSLPSVTNLTTSPKYFDDGTPASNDGTPLCASWGNMVQEEICNAATVRGASLSTSDRTQVATAMRHANAIRSATQAGSLSGDDADSTGGFPHTHVAIGCLDASVSGGMAGQLASNTCDTSGVRGVALGALSCVVSGNSAAALAAESSTVSGDQSAVIASDHATASGNSSACIAADYGAATVGGAAVIASGSGAGTGCATRKPRSATIGCHRSETGAGVSGGQSVLVASDRCELVDDNCFAMGYHATTTPTFDGLTNKNLTLKIDGTTGDVYSDGTIGAGAADFAEMFPTVDGKALPPGRLVAGAGKAVKLAGPKDRVRGVVSVNPAVLGNAAPLQWSGRYEVDEFGQVKTTTVPMVRWPELSRPPVLVRPKWEGRATAVPVGVAVPADREEWVEHERVYDPSSKKHVTVDVLFYRWKKLTEPGVVTRPGYDDRLSLAPMPLPGDAEHYTVEARVESAAWDPARKYTPRSERPDDYCAVALTGQVRVATGAPVTVGDLLGPDGEGRGVPVKSPNGRPVEVLEVTAPYDATRGYGIALCLVG